MVSNSVINLPLALTHNLDVSRCLAESGAVGPGVLRGRPEVKPVTSPNPNPDPDPDPDPDPNPQNDLYVTIGWFPVHCDRCCRAR